MAIPSRQIGWGTESNLLWQILKQLNKLTSVLFGLKEAATPKYKVFTALLTQSGGDAVFGQNGGTAVGYSPELTIGVTYYISDNFEMECDFTNVGAPNNEVGTYFVATGTTPNTWGTYGNLIFNTGAPVATVLENTIGDVWFEYFGDGQYKLKTSIEILNDKLYSTILLFSIGLDGLEETYRNSIYHYDNNTIAINTQRNDGNWVLINNFLNNTPIEIRVYN